MPPLPLAVASDRSESLPWSAQRLVNYYATGAVSPSKSPVLLRPTPGLVLASDTGQTKPVRGMHVMNQIPYVLAGTRLYSFSSAGVATAMTGTIPGTDFVSMVDNGTQLAIAANGGLYVLAGSAVTQVTDPDLGTVGSIAYLDGYGIFNANDESGDWGITALDDFTDVDGLDFAQAEKKPDGLVRVFVYADNLVLFGRETAEIWQNTGAADFPFERVPGGVITKGCAAKGSVAQADNAVFWLGDDLIVWRASGVSPVRVSTHAIEDVIAEWAIVSDVEAFVYVDGGHTYYVLTSPSEERTLVFDVSSNLWHERQSGIAEFTRWRARGYAFAYNRHFVGDYETGKVYELDRTVYADAGETMRGRMVLPPISSQERRSTFHMLQLDVEAGVGLSTGQGSDPQVAMRLSRDSAKTWGPERWRSMGAIGEYKNRAIWRKNGQARQLTAEFVVTDPVPRNVCAFYGEWTRDAH